MKIGFYHELSITQKDNIKELCSKTNERINVLDQWTDDGQICILVKFIVWGGDPIRCIFPWISEDLASAFRFHNDPRAMKLIKDHLENTKESIRKVSV